MFIESGIIIFVGLLLLTFKLERYTVLRLMNYPLALDIAVSVVAYALHWGTFTGIMAAAVAALMCSSYTQLYRYIRGHVDRHGKYHVGHFPYKNIK